MRLWRRTLVDWLMLQVNVAAETGSLEQSNNCERTANLGFEQTWRYFLVV